MGFLEEPWKQAKISPKTLKNSHKIEKKTLRTLKLGKNIWQTPWYLYKSTIWSYMEYCCHAWAGAPNTYLELLDKLQKQICRTVGLSLAASLEPLAHLRNIASLSLFYRYYFGRHSSELAQLVYFLILEGGLLIILIDCMIFLSPFLDVTRISISTVSFLAQLDSGILCL